MADVVLKRHCKLLSFYNYPWKKLQEELVQCLREFYMFGRFIGVRERHTFDGAAGLSGRLVEYGCLKGIEGHEQNISSLPTDIVRPQQ